MKNKKNKKKLAPFERPHIPAECCFFYPDYADALDAIDPHREPYKWVGWGLIIRQLRDFAGMDQELFGKLLKGYNRGQIARYETEQSEPPIDFWIKMARTFGLNITWALTGQGAPYVTEFIDCEEQKRLEQWVDINDEKKNLLRKLRGR